MSTNFTGMKANSNQEVAERGRKPDYKLRYLNKRTEERGSLGAAWLNDDGSISIVLNDKVVLAQTKDEVLTLFPADYKPQVKKPWESEKVTGG